MSLESHDLDGDGDHDPDQCELCLEKNCSKICDCKCGECCERLIIEVTHRDAEREPRIRECQPIKGFTEEQIGYLLNDPENDHACHFFDRTTRLCTIYQTRPLCCRLFNCDGPFNPIANQE